jgi:hypothetical protein
MSKNYRNKPEFDEIEFANETIVEPVVEEPKDEWKTESCSVTYYNLDGKTIVFLFNGTLIQMSLTEFVKVENGKVKIQYKGELDKDIQFKI